MTLKPCPGWRPTSPSRTGQRGRTKRLVGRRLGCLVNGLPASVGSLRVFLRRFGPLGAWTLTGHSADTAGRDHARDRPGLRHERAHGDVVGPG